MQTVIIAGGKGERLGLIDIPKPMVKLQNKPLLEYQIELAKKYGSKEIFIMSGYMSDVIKDYFKDGKNFNIKINHITEIFPLGTAGCLKQLENTINKRFMVFYGDIVMDFDIHSFIEFDKNQKESIATIIIHPNNHPYDSDLIETDKNNKITKIIKKPHNDNNYYKNLVNAGVYIFSPEIFKFIKENEYQDIAGDILPKIIDKNIYGYKTAEYIKDLGTKERFSKIKTDFEKGNINKFNKTNKRSAIFLDRDGVINKNMDTSPSLDNFQLLEKVENAIKKINESGFLAIVITNQPMIAKGFITFEETEKIHNKLETLLGEKEAYLDEIYFCPHHPKNGFKGEIKELKIDCNCRKPKTGLFMKAKEDFNIDFNTSWMIGDSKCDIEAGKNIGAKTILISDKNEYDADFSAKNLNEAINLILNEGQIK